MLRGLPPGADETRIQRRKPRDCVAQNLGLTTAIYGAITVILVELLMFLVAIVMALRLASTKCAGVLVLARTASF